MSEENLDAKVIVLVRCDDVPDGQRSEAAATLGYDSPRDIFADLIFDAHVFAQAAHIPFEVYPIEKCGNG